MIGLAARLANRMTLPELQEWQAKLEELDE